MADMREALTRCLCRLITSQEQSKMLLVPLRICLKRLQRVTACVTLQSVCVCVLLFPDHSQHVCSTGNARGPCDVRLARATGDLNLCTTPYAVRLACVLRVVVVIHSC